MIRTRDFVAMLAALVLSRMAWNDNNTESLQASVHLAFYSPRNKATVMSPMDVDGDGTNEALAVLQKSASSTSTWEWNILDLKALSPTRGRMTNIALPPFQPPILFSYSDDRDDNTVSPLRITTGQVLVQPMEAIQSRTKMDLSKVNADTDINERNRHYFCGKDWHDASQRCSHPCPTGQASECPDNQRCYADTPCNIESASRKQPLIHEDTQVLFDLTPGGGLPSIVTLWTDGALSMTSITNHPGDASTSSSTSATKSKKGTRSSSLDLQKMWKIDLLPDASHPQNILWVEHNLLFLDAYDSTETLGAEHGMVIVSGTYVDEGKMKNEPEDDDNAAAGKMHSFWIAVDAMRGTVLWDTFRDEQSETDPLPLPIVRGVSSYARRRSRIPSLIGDMSSTVGNINEQSGLSSLPDCQVTFRHHLKQVLPYAYWTAKDSHMAALHLDQYKKHHNHFKKNDRSHPVIGKDSPKATPRQQKTKQKKWHHRFHKFHEKTLIAGRPNVLVTQSQGGMQIRSLRNGRPLCHTSFLEETLYADLNNDGTLDQVQIFLSNKNLNHADKWVRKLVSKIEKKKDPRNSLEKIQVNQNSLNNVCHAMALSGLPAREDLFSTSLCGSAHENLAVHPSVALDTIAPVVVESLSGRRNTRDVVVALNNGMIHRIQGRSGRKEWSITGNHHSDFPTWDESTHMGNAVMMRAQSPNIAAPIRPIVLAGENSVAILSVKGGNILAMVPFPQTLTSRPLLADVTGDGTTDLVITTIDGIWGFQIQIQSGRPVFLRIMVGILLFSLMLALLRNRFGGSRKDVRATDL